MEGFALGVLHLNLGAALALLFRLSVFGLTAIYRWLTVYMWVYAVEFVIAATIPLRSTLYGNLYMLGESADLVLSILVVREVIGLAFAGHPALAVFGRKAVAFT